MTEKPDTTPESPTTARSKKKLIAPIVVLLMLLAGVIWYVDDGHELFWPKRWGVVTENAIYRSGEPLPIATARPVKAHGIRTIVDLGAHTPGTEEEIAAQQKAEALDITRYRFGLIGDATGDPNDYVAALHLINDPANQPVWVHCAAGSERTGMLIALQRVIVDGWDVDRAYEETHQYDHDDNPHLREMLDRWLPEIERAYRTGEAIAYDPTTDGLGAAGRGETNGGRTGPFEQIERATEGPEVPEGG
ncbi:MAG: tyrosine-protein phosphatase [Phycisphaerales bacterium JB060]